MSEISELAQISGLTALIAVLIAIFFGIVVLHKAIKTKERLLYYFFLCIIFTISPWFPSGFGYLYWVLTNTTLNYQIYVLIGTVAVPIAIIAWLNIYMSMIKPNKKKIVLVLYSIFSIIFEMYVIYFLFLSPGAPVKPMLGIFHDPSNPIDIDYKGFVLVYLGLSIMIACITGIHLAITSIKIKEKPEIVWKGRFLLISFLLFGFAAIFDSIIQMGPLLLVIVRVSLALTAFFFYLGFILPKWIKKIFSIED